MSSTFEQAKEQAAQLANEMRDGAEKVRQNLRDSTDKAYSYKKLTQQLRLVQIVALPILAITLYSQADEIGVIGFIFAIAIIALDGYLVFTKWQKSTDGRKDLENFLATQNHQAKLRYAMMLLGPICLALLIHTFAPIIPTYLGSLVFNLTNYALTLAATICVLLDTFETLKAKIH